MRPLQVFLNVREQQLPGLFPLRSLAAQLQPDRARALVAHPERVLHHDRIDFPSRSSAINGSDASKATSFTRFAPRDFSACTAPAELDSLSAKIPARSSC